jgi:uncharacterized membrane protein (UPF0127 family)
MVLVNATKQVVIADRCRFANSLWKRMVGLLNRARLEQGEGLLIDRCYGIHTVGMRFSIDVVFLDHNLQVIRVVSSLPPFRTCVVKKAVYVLELPSGTASRTSTVDGDQLRIRSTENGAAKSTVCVEPQEVHQHP